MNAEPEHLASSYLDGELTDEERRLAERDPAVMAEVESLRALRNQITSVQPPSAAAREAAISAAMTAFRQLHGAGDEDPAAEPILANAGPDTMPDVVPVRPRRERDLSRWLGVAAALVVVAALGIVAVRAGGGGGNDDSVADEAASEPAATSAARVPQADDLDATAEEPADELMAATETAQEEAAAEDAGSDAESALADQAEEAPTEEQSMTAEATAEEPASDDMSATMTTLTTSGPTAVPLPDPARYFDEDLPIESPIQLQSAALYLIERRDTGELGATPEYRCPFAFVLDRAVYRVGTTDFEVLIDVDESTNTVSAVDEPTCDVIAESPITADDEP
jgi:hypothetical protein